MYKTVAKVVINILQGSAFTQTMLGEPCCKFPLVLRMCAKK